MYLGQHSNRVVGQTARYREPGQIDAIAARP